MLLSKTVYSLESALKDIPIPSKRLQGFMFINRYLSPEVLKMRGEFPSRDVFSKVIAAVLNALGDTNPPVTRLAFETLTGLISNFHILLE
jgi:hypothetical protein